MSRDLPPNPNLGHLRKQAKELLRRLLPANPGARLADAQHAIAREYGFPSWPKLKAHVEGLPRPAATDSPFVGGWTANLSKSSPHPANPFQSAILRFDVSGDTVTITHSGVDADGREERSTNVLRADGRERSAGPGRVAAVRWIGSHVLEVVRKKDGRVEDRGTYEVSADGTTMTVTGAGQVVVLDRV